MANDYEKIYFFSNDELKFISHEEFFLSDFFDNKHKDFVKWFFSNQNFFLLDMKVTKKK